jgi:hypothetical protein
MCCATCYRIPFARDRAQDEEREVEQAADFPIKEARKLQQRIELYEPCRLSLMKPRLYFIDEGNSRQVA